MILSTTINAIGGLALFLLAMLMMTEGLKLFAGEGLKQLLGRFTSTPLKGVLAGVLVTGLVQSSTAVTVAVIGFVNVGLMGLRQGLGVVFGTNVGTTVTGWLVSLVGFGFKIESFALPILALGVALRLGASSRRNQGLGEALAGFGLFFLGLSILKDSFGSLAQLYGNGVPGFTTNGGVITFLLVGFVITVLTQSSSAAIAIILTAATGGVIGIQPAAAAVIGANLGTTTTAAVAVLRATPNAKRLALGHILFNLITGVVALSLLPGMLWLVAQLADGLDLEGSPAAVLALFHTVFNLLGVVIMLPLTGRLTRLLEKRFRSLEEEAGRPHHLDASLANTPSLAVAGLRAELLRLRDMTNRLVRGSMAPSPVAVKAFEQQAAAIHSLVVAVAEFVGTVRTATMSREEGEQLARALRTARYLDEAARLSGTALALHQKLLGSSDAETVAVLQQLFDQIEHCCRLAHQEEPAEDHSDQERLEALEGFEQQYQLAKAELLDAAVSRRQSITVVNQLLGELSGTRRMVEQLVKADRLLRSPALAEAIESEKRQENAA
ncbi:MAG: Na/Pi cotransporter family protein [Geobacter sp.]